MSILIKGVKMPKEDELLCIRIYPSGKVTLDMDLQCKQVAEASELPTHGDLIDIDWLKEECEEPNVWWETATEMKMILANPPIVIPAERSEDGKDKI